MKQTQIHKYYKNIASLGQIGSLPASGTWGSLVALPFAWWLIGTPYLILLIILSFTLGVLTIHPLIKGEKQKDPSFVTIDEFMGQLLVFSFLDKDLKSPILFIFGFLFFRLFDILKPWPASFFDKKIHTGFGVMMDDFVAGIYAALGLAFLEIMSYYL